MKCKICGKELDGDATLCASCGKENSVQFEIEQLPTPDAVELTSEEKEEVEESDVKMNLLSECEISKKSNHFSRFDHSIVVIEYKEMKITTSIEQAEKLLEKLI